MVRRPLVSWAECAAHSTRGSCDGSCHSGPILPRASSTRTQRCANQPVARCASCGSHSDCAEAPPKARRARRPWGRARSVGARPCDASVVGTTTVDPRRPSPRQSAGQRGASLGRDRLRRSHCRRSCDGPVGILDAAATVRAADGPHISPRRIRSARRPHVDAGTRLGPGAGTRVPGQLPRREGNECAGSSRNR